MTDTTLQRTNDTRPERQSPCLHRRDDPLSATTCFRLPAEIDMANASLVLDDLRAFAARHLRPRQLHIDCSALSFIDGRGLLAMAVAAHELEQILLDGQDPSERPIVLHHLAPRCRRLFEITGLDAHFTFR